MGRVLAFVRDRFFGNWDRGLTTISFVATLVGAVITVFLVKYPDNVPQYITYRDLLFWFALILMSIVVVGKYIRREEVIRSQLDLLFNQFKLSHDLVHSYRDELFRWYFQPNIYRHKLTDRELSIFRHLCFYITENLKTSFSEYFKSRGIDIGNDLSVSVKLIITHKEVLDRFKLSQEEQEKIRSKELWIITIYRDQYTHIHLPVREKGLKIYDIEKNTAFRRLVEDKMPAFCHNDLQSLGNVYENENKDWRKYYNAALVVPIRYLSADRQRYRCYGALAVDSLNEKKINDLYNHQCEYILAHAADLLATFFLLLEFIEYIPTQVVPVVSPVATGP